jgi:hypothetical protein
MIRTWRAYAYAFAMMMMVAAAVVPAPALAYFEKAIEGTDATYVIENDDSVSVYFQGYGWVRFYDANYRGRYNMCSVRQMIRDLRDEASDYNNPAGVDPLDKIRFISNIQGIKETLYQERTGYIWAVLYDCYVGTEYTPSSDGLPYWHGILCIDNEGSRENPNARFEACGYVTEERFYRQRD